jgi:iron(III) transport system permease protein
MNAGAWIAVASGVLLAILVIYPLIVLIVRSLGGGPLTLEYFQQAFVNTSLRAALSNTVVVSVASIAFAVVVGVTLALFTHRAKVALPRAFDVLIILPLFVSPIVLAVSWTFVAGPVGIFNGLLVDAFGPGAPQLVVKSLGGIAFVMGLYFVPYIYLYASIGLRSIDPSFEESSYTLGAGTTRTALRVTLPLATPAILAGTLLVLVLAITHFSIPLILGRPDGIYVVTTVMYDMVQLFPPELAQAAALSLILVSLSVAFVLGQRLLVRRQSYVSVIGKARAGHAIRGGWFGILGTVVCGIYVTVFVVIPFLALGAVSLMPYLSFGNTDFTLSHYEYVLFDYPLTGSAFRNSFLLAAVGATVTVLFTALVGYVITRGRGVWSGLLDLLSIVPLAVPAVAFGVALLAAWINVPFLYGTLLILLVAYVTIYLPFGVRGASANLAQIHEDLESVSRTSGAGAMRTFRRIAIPLLRPGLTTIWVLLFISMIKESGASIFLYSYGTETMAVAMLGLWTFGTSPETAAMAVIQSFLLILVVVLFRRVTNSDLRTGV